MSRTTRNKLVCRRSKLWDMGQNVHLRSGLHLGNPRKARAKGKQQAHQVQRLKLKQETLKAVQGRALIKED